ncbi:MAG: UpxY family transcription antiterminator [Calditerrivibrio sp.]|nr:UpxY family transcription antiterminator [Calditerrivibrio sp.]
MNWYCVYVKSRHEFKVRERLLNNNFEAYLPTVRKIRKWKDRKKIIDFPLFPGYLFLYMNDDKESIIKVLKTPGVVKFIKDEQNHPAPLSENDIANIKRLVGSNQEIDSYPYLKEGQKVRITDGPLKGMIGLLSKKEDITYFIVTIELLKRSISVKIDPSNIEAYDGH